MNSITSIESKRFEIREPIRSFLTTVKEYFGYDACALYLISDRDTMHKTEKEEEFDKRFSNGSLLIECSDEEIEGNGKPPGPIFVKKVSIKFTGDKIDEKDESNNDIFKEKVGIVCFEEQVLSASEKEQIKDYSCYKKIKEEYVKNISRDKNINIKYNKNDTPYKILKFIGVDDSYDDGKKHKWTYDYKVRPNKYIVFDQSFFTQIPQIKDKKILYIENEGITAMVGRCDMCVHMDNDQIYKIVGPKVRLKKDDTEREIHPVCSELLAIPIYKGSEIKGVVRLDIYDKPKNKKDDKNENENYKTIKEFMDYKKAKDGSDIGIKLINTNEMSDKEKKIAEEMNRKIQAILDLIHVVQKLCLQVIEVSSDITKKDAYDDLFQGKTMIDAILRIEEKANIENTSNKKIYELTKHLFFVFQRHTYVGYEEIMARTMLYIKDVFKSVGLEKYYDLTERKLFDFRDHENLMLYSTEKYRDHFMHQFHVFVMGYIFINAIGIGKIKKRINERLQNVDEYQEIEIDDEGVLRIWILISLFHDIAYIFQQYDKTMQKFISDNLLADIPVYIDWGNILSSKKNKVSYIDSISELTRFFTSQDELKQTSKTELLKNYIQAIEDNQDHGVLSAILLINLFNKTIEGNYIGNHEIKSKRIVEIYLAALAISMHNSCIYKTLKEDANIGYISFESFPLEFLLMYCDTAQEWGRKKEVDKVFYDAPVLESIIVDIVNEKESNEKTNATNDNAQNKTDVKKSKIMCKLKYNGLNHPNEEKLNSFFLEKLSKFCSSTISFGVQYAYKTSKKRKTRFYFSCDGDEKSEK